MYDIDLDLVLKFLPPMSEAGPGIRLTRTFQLPFPPSSEVAVYSKEWEGLDGAFLGYCLKDITWDVDRGRFFATTYSSMIGDPIAMIPHEIRRLVDCGWQWGSYEDKYVVKDRRGKERRKLRSLKRIKRWDPDEAEKWDSDKRAVRPAEFMTVWHAVIATMASIGNNCSAAYAILKTGVCLEIPENKLPHDLSLVERRYRDAIQEFHDLGSDGQWDWRDRVKRKYPRLIDVVEAMG